MLPRKVSLVMPTYNRQKYVPIAIRCFTQQTYPNVELIIVDDGDQQMALPADGRIQYIRLDTKTPTGTKRNIGAAAAFGEIVANWDDDDWSSPHRIEEQVERLARSGKAVTGYNATISYDEATGLFYRNPGGPPYLASGTSQCYLRSWWKEHPFPDVSYGEDSVFSRTARLEDQLAIADPGKMMVARKHANNTDFVNIQRLIPWSEQNIALEFFKAIHNPRPTLDYIWERHECTRECAIDAESRFYAPIVEYKTKRIPEIRTR
jgi:glycosyltransferase involved in cell wall biosynthesis